MRVAILSLHDYSGSGERIARAVESSGWRSTFIRYRPHPFGFPADLDLTTKSGRVNYQALTRARRAIKAADVLHFKGDDPVPDRRWGLRSANLLLPEGKPRILTVGGSNFRRHAEGAVSRARHPMEVMVRNTHRRVALTADLNYPDFRGEWVPAVADCSRPRLWRSRGVPVIAHSPTHRGKKGTTDVVLPALEILRETHQFELDLIEGVPFEESVRRKESATIFVDQCKAGFYGNSALEAMSVGVPTLCYISANARAQGGELMRSCPVRGFDPSPEGLASAIGDLLSDDLERVSRETFEWTRRAHSPQSVGRQYDRIYREALGR